MPKVYTKLSELPLPFIFVRKDKDGKPKLPAIRVNVRTVPSSRFPFRIVTEWDEKGNGEWTDFWEPRRAKTEQSAIAQVWNVSLYLNRALNFLLVPEEKPHHA